MLINNIDKLEKALQIEEMWTTYETAKISHERNLAQQLTDEILAFGGDKRTSSETKEPNPPIVEEFASSGDIRNFITEEIEQKLEWAQANACRAYIDSTF